MWVNYGESVSEPGSIEKVPIKVVPMYIETHPIASEESSPETDDTQRGETDRPARQKTIIVGALATASAVLVAVLTGVATAVASSGVYRISTVLAWAAIGLSVVAVVAGVWATATNRGRRWGVVAIVLGLAGNPWLLRVILEAVGGARS